jgi:hypothetical protein
VKTIRVLFVMLLTSLLFGCGNTEQLATGTTGTKPGITPGLSDPYAGLLPTAKGSASVSFSGWSTEWKPGISSTTFNPDTVRASQTSGTIITMYADGQTLRCITNKRATTGSSFALVDVKAQASYTASEYIKILSPSISCAFYSDTFSVAHNAFSAEVSTDPFQYIYGCGGSLAFSSVSSTGMSYSFTGNFCFAKLTIPAGQSPPSYVFSGIRPAVTIQFSGTVENVLSGIVL